MKCKSCKYFEHVGWDDFCSYGNRKRLLPTLFCYSVFDVMQTAVVTAKASGDSKVMNQVSERITMIIDKDSEVKQVGNTQVVEYQSKHQPIIVMDNDKREIKVEQVTSIENEIYKDNYGRLFCFRCGARTEEVLDEIIGHKEICPKCKI